MAQQPHTFNTSAANEEVIAGSGTFIKGDDDPNDFTFEDGLNSAEVLNLFERNGKARKIMWFVNDVFKNGLLFKIPESIIAPKFKDKLFNYDTWWEWFEFSKGKDETKLAMIWSEVLGDCITIHFTTEDENITTLYKETEKPFFGETKDDFVQNKAIYGLTDSIGYEVIEQTEGVIPEPEVYKITLKDIDKVTEDTKEIREFYVHASRVVRYKAQPVRLDQHGSSMLSTGGKYMLIQEQILKAVFETANNLCAGLQITRVNGKTEKDNVKASLTNDVWTRLNKLWYDGDQPLDEIVKMIIPDLKTGQLMELYLISQKEIANSLNISIRNLGEEDISSGFGSGAAESSTGVTNDATKHLQDHYKPTLEHEFFMMNRVDTRFTFIVPEAPVPVDDFKIGITNNTENEDINKDKDEEDGETKEKDSKAKAD